ncbi:hypothetical protein ACVU7I_07815 [Patulibacter sp. S7RM1-6]
MLVPLLLIVVGLALYLDAVGFGAWARRVRWGRVGGEHAQSPRAPRIVGAALVLMGLVALVV